MESTRTVWARGLTPNERGKAITLNGHDYFLRNAEHFDKTVLTVVTTVEVDHMTEVVVHE